jgi:hypothetical protein
LPLTAMICYRVDSPLPMPLVRIVHYKPQDAERDKLDCLVFERCVDLVRLGLLTQDGPASFYGEAETVVHEDCVNDQLDEPRLASTKEYYLARGDLQPGPCDGVGCTGTWRLTFTGGRELVTNWPGWQVLRPI